MSERRAAETKTASMRVKLKYPDVETFLYKYGPNISRGGIFIATKTPRPMGTPVRFEFVLVHEGQESVVLRGEGTVNFLREPDPAAPNRAAGMGVRFTRLLDDGQALVDRALRMRGSQPEPPPPPDLPRGVREVTGEVELTTGPVPKLEPATEPALAAEPVPPPDAAPAPVAVVAAPPPIPSVAPARAENGTNGHLDTDLDALARESGVSAERLQAVLGRRGARGVDPARSTDELESLMTGEAPETPSATEASQRIDALLSRRSR